MVSLFLLADHRSCILQSTIKILADSAHTRSGDCLLQKCENLFPSTVLHAIAEQTGRQSFLTMVIATYLAPEPFQSTFSHTTIARMFVMRLCKPSVDY